MSRLVPSDQIERVVGVQRHPTEHWGRAVSAEQRVYILHSQECLAHGEDLRGCLFSLALDDGIDPKTWVEDVPVRLLIENTNGEAWLLPAASASGRPEQP